MHRCGRYYIIVTETTAWTTYMYLPPCLRGLQLTGLDLQSSKSLVALPDWLGELPLVYLDLSIDD